jgi:hypothetical protein
MQVCILSIPHSSGLSRILLHGFPMRTLLCRAIQLPKPKLHKHHA